MQTAIACLGTRALPRPRGTANSFLTASRTNEGPVAVHRPRPAARAPSPAPPLRAGRCALSSSLPQLQIPDWVDVVKTACFKELPPLDRDWYYIRAGERTAARVARSPRVVLAAAAAAVRPAAVRDGAAAVFGGSETCTRQALSHSSR